MNCIRANVDIVVIEGGTFDQTFQWKSGSPLEAVDLTGYTGAMAIRAKLSDSAPLLAVPNQAGPWAADGDTGVYILPNGSPPDDKGKFQVYLKDSETLGLCAAHKDIAGVYDLFLTTAAGETVFQLYGAATIRAAVKR